MARESRKYLYQPVRRLDLAIAIGDFVDAGATGTYTATQKLPAGAKVIATKLKTFNGFAGDTTATATVGKAGALDDYFGTAADVLAAGDDYGQPATEAESLVSAATAPVVTVTGGADFTSIVTAAAASADASLKPSMVVSIYYLDLNSKSV
jgi:hypothetical protein